MKLFIGRLKWKVAEYKIVHKLSGVEEIQLVLSPGAKGWWLEFIRVSGIAGGQYIYMCVYMYLDLEREQRDESLC